MAAAKAHGLVDNKVVGFSGHPDLAEVRAAEGRGRGRASALTDQAVSLPGGRLEPCAGDG